MTEQPQTPGFIGVLHVAPVGSPIPSSTGDQLDDTYRFIGYVTYDGVTRSQSPDFLHYSFSVAVTDADDDVPTDERLTYVLDVRHEDDMLRIVLPNGGATEYAYRSSGITDIEVRCHMDDEGNLEYRYSTDPDVFDRQTHVSDLDETNPMYPDGLRQHQDWVATVPVTAELRFPSDYVVRIENHRLLDMVTEAVHRKIADKVADVIVREMGISETHPVVHQMRSTIAVPMEADDENEPPYKFLPTEGC